VIKEGMVFPLETYCPASDGFSGARIEEELVVTDKGHKVISLFPAEELPISASIEVGMRAWILSVQPAHPDPENCRKPCASTLL
jgi:hypothetical protein